MKNISTDLTLPELSRDNPTVGERVVDILDEQGRTKLWLAQELGISKQALNYLLKHSSCKKYLPEIAELLEVSPTWLETGEGSQQIGAQHAVTRIPCVALSTIENIEESLSQASEKIFYVSGQGNGKYFAVVLDNSSMLPSFRKEAILIFDLEKKPIDGCYVLAKLKNSSEYLFRHYLTDGREILLRAENIDFTDISIRSNDIEVIGVLVQSRNSF